MPEQFDAVVVGSGFGGSVATYRLAEAGRRVCLLERGQKYPPGSFARSPREMARNVWDPSEGLFGLFDIWSFRSLDAIVSSGLGGGSLIFANVLLRKDEKTFVRERPGQPGYECWPVTRQELDPEYDKVEHILGAARYPLDAAGYRDSAKTKALRDAASRVGLAWELPPLAVSFGDPPQPGAPIQEQVPNLHGAPRQTCRLVGECDFGCNYGSKNTLDLTYISRAHATHNADIRTCCEVKAIGRSDDGQWQVEYVRHEPEREEPASPSGIPPRHTVRSRILVLSAGTLGTPYLLLRNRAAIPTISSRLGTNFSTNGDYLGFLTSRREQYNPSHGPLITSTIRMPDATNGDRGFFIQEGGYPGFLDWIIESALPVRQLRKAVRLVLIRAWQNATRRPSPSAVSNQVSALLGPGARSAGVLPLLGMGRDAPVGRMRLRSGFLDVDWAMGPSQPYFRRLRETLGQIADALGANYRDSFSRFLSRAITVHPLGGCPMGFNSREGVVDDHGEVFDCPGLFIADGSVMPGPVGANPSLTIAALSERFSMRMIERTAHKGP